MAENLADVDELQRIRPANLDNTIAALNVRGRRSIGPPFTVSLFDYEQPEFQAVQREMAPRLAAFGDQITQERGL
jgi:peptidyl-dipeptidase Dcp